MPAFCRLPIVSDNYQRIVSDAVEELFEPADPSRITSRADSGMAVMVRSVKRLKSRKRTVLIFMSASPKRTVDMELFLAISGGPC